MMQAIVSCNMESAVLKLGYLSVSHGLSAPFAFVSAINEKLTVNSRQARTPQNTHLESKNGGDKCPQTERDLCVWSEQIELSINTVRAEAAS
jgi:hypothetical protein